MKRISILLMTFALLFVSACSSSKNEEVVSNEEKEETKEEVVSEGLVEEVDLSNFDIGTVSDYTYTNDYLGLKLPLDENWYFASENELAQISSLTAEALDNTYAGEMLENGSVIILCYAQKLNGADNVNVGVEKKPLENITVDQIINLQLSVVEEQYKSMGLEDATCTKGETVFLGEKVPCMITIASTDNGTMHQTSVMHLVDGLIVTITATSFNEDITEQILAEFELQ